MVTASNASDHACANALASGNVIAPLGRDDGCSVESGVGASSLVGVVSDEPIMATTTASPTPASLSATRASTETSKFAALSPILATITASANPASLSRTMSSLVNPISSPTTGTTTRKASVNAILMTQPETAGTPSYNASKAMSHDVLGRSGVLGCVELPQRSVLISVRAAPYGQQ